MPELVSVLRSGCHALPSVCAGCEGCLRPCSVTLPDVHKRPS